MGRIGVAMAAVFLALCFPAVSRAAPYIIGDHRDPRCIETWRMATAAFFSKASSFLWPVPAPVGPGTSIILDQRAQDISGGGGLVADPSRFEEITLDDPARRGTIYWRRGTAHGPHLAVVDSPFNWQGDWYTVFLLPAAATPASLAQQLVAEGTRGGPSLVPVLGDNRWTPPIVLTSARAGGDWIIDRGEPYRVMPPWHVYVERGGRMVEPCRISFGDPGRGGVSRLPAAVRRFAADVNGTLGSGADEGTLQPTAGIRLAVAQEWANAALRPWAATRKPYNTPRQVDEDLRAWSRDSGYDRRMYDRIVSDRVRAEDALAHYYSAHFKAGPASARRLGRRMIEHMLDMYFVFQREPLRFLENPP